MKYFLGTIFYSLAHFVAALCIGAILIKFPREQRNEAYKWDIFVYD